ncbi:MAG: LysR family transcriptional regulator [Butyrivibrio sp.]|uniref:LysR family transcriptional regulator n=1 Tax=Butyrivibrio sp. TaxID=28121 RepID=UPI0025B8FA4A|nr:LysR family transcriptional regulator [Butyrivibrio sp.]MBQ6587483.1 LysR family transcriptional regulator [Butyrivibrio sp.]
MELLQLRYFRTAAMLENFTKAAEYHQIPQSAISKTVKNLERELGCELFSRNGKKIVLNDNGKMFLEKVDIALKSLDSGVEELKGHKLSVISIKVFSGIHFVSKMISEFEKEYRNIKVINYHGQGDALMNQDEDFVFFQLPIDEGSYDSRFLMKDELKIAISKSNPLSSRKKLNLEELKSEKFVSYGDGNQLRQMTEELCQEKGFKPNIIFEAASFDALRSMVEAGVGISLVPEMSWSLEKTDHVSLVPITTHPYRSLVIAWKKDKALTHEQKLFLDYVCKWFS